MRSAKSKGSCCYSDVQFCPVSAQSLQIGDWVQFYRYYSDIDWGHTYTGKITRVYRHTVWVRVWWRGDKIVFRGITAVHRLSEETLSTGIASAIYDSRPWWLKPLRP